MKLYFKTLHSESVRTTEVELFRENDQRVKAVGYFQRMFDRVLNATLLNNLL